MQDYFSRSRLLLGEDAMDRLARARVAVFGLGGVGGYVCEALARSGVGHLELTDADRVAPSNLNRQIIATVDTVGRLKTEVMAERIRSISPGAETVLHETFVLPENVYSFPFETYDYVVDAVDTVAAKLALIQRAEETGTLIISCMGAGNKLDPGQFRVADIYETRICPLARVMRKELKKRGIRKLKVVYSEEEPIQPGKEPEGEQPEDGTGPVHPRRSTPGSVSFVPSAAGLMIAGEVIRDLTGK
jgi:tRNA A37 threonylcarbamoyladenosine dehydratase